MEFIISALFILWMFGGALYIVYTADIWTVKPTHVGDLLVRILFLPHVALQYLIYGLYFVTNKFIINPIINSNWWNKEL